MRTFVSVTVSFIGRAAHPERPGRDVCCAALGHAFRRLLAPEAGSFSSQGQIATGLASVALPGGLLWALYELVVR